MYKSDDLGGHSIEFTKVLDYLTNHINFLVLSDDHADGMVHIYYGPSLDDAKLSLSEVLGADATQVIAEIDSYLSSRAG